MCGLGVLLTCTSLLLTTEPLSSPLYPILNICGTVFIRVLIDPGDRRKQEEKMNYFNDLKER